MDAFIPWIVALVVLAVVALVISRTVRIVPQARAGIVERLGRYDRTMNAGLNFAVPFIDRVKPYIDLREQVVSFPPQPVITEDNLVVSIDTVIYFQVTDPKAATYEIANYIQAIEQLTVTTLRNVVGGMDLEQALTSREEINSQLRGVLDEATGKWGVRVNRVEIKAIDPPKSVQDSMEKQMRAEREKRATILTAEGQKQSQILTAEGERQAAVLRAEGEAQAARLRAAGEAAAVETVFDAVNLSGATPQVLAYQYLRQLPSIAAYPSNKLWIIPSELTQALGSLGQALTPGSPAAQLAERAAQAVAGTRPPVASSWQAERVGGGDGEPADADDGQPAVGGRERAPALPSASEAVAEAAAAVEEAGRAAVSETLPPSSITGHPTPPATAQPVPEPAPAAGGAIAASLGTGRPIPAAGSAPVPADEPSDEPPQG